MIGRPIESMPERFWDKVDKHSGTYSEFVDTLCWEWMAHKTDRGYGMFWLNDRNHLAHRISYELTKGIIPDGLEIDHLCRNHSCVNPDHLEAVSPSENHRRIIHIEFCLNGHEYTVENTYIRKDNGSRMCKRCHADAELARYRKLKVK
jgi:hypothetical protein